VAAVTGLDHIVPGVAAANAAGYDEVTGPGAPTRSFVTAFNRL
jgi:hypothetical protein